ncbi:MAG: hypothetical protein FOGNACKC_05275 [Anaerolineae bacterium]|nr:hypothetical protein [Anaerolineae bacterium]
MQAPPEKLGSFYLGAEYDLSAGQRLDAPVNYDARDLTTHAICVGMTGSGKTGLCLGLLEEAAIDKVPTILIDPKGDITNLLLQFPELRPEDFAPWVNADDARRKGKTVDEFAAATADMWRNGLADWGQGSERIKMLQDSADFTIYTPGSDAGLPVSIMGSLAAPGLDFATNAEAVRERISGTVAALLGLVGINADPVRSREAILLSNIFEHFWSQNKSLDLATLILSIQNPPVRQLGVFDVDTFFPEKDRFVLAMDFNNLLASPSFQNWLMGDPLDIDRMMYTADGQPRHSIFYIAHLSDSERMFFVTLLLENLLTWMRRQAGTTSLRALLYFDEIFGYFPPTAEPPSKRPLLTLLKQARAFGLGCVLVTQNPVDLDYKGLTNAGTWFIGKLQAERDKARVLDGLKGAIAQAGGKSGADYDSIISKLGNRVFLLHNVHSDGPIVFQTRWAMSYLRGPLTRPQVKQLMDSRKQAAPPPAPAVSAPPPAAAAAAAAATAAPPSPPAAATGPATPAGFSAIAPTLDSSVPQVYLPAEVQERAAVRQLSQDAGTQIEVERVQFVYEPAIIGSGEVRFVDRSRNLNEQIDKLLLAPAPEDLPRFEWDRAERLKLTARDLLSRPEQADPDQGPFFAPIPPGLNNSRELKSLEKKLSDWLYYNSKQTITVHKELGLFQHPEESERDFRIRLRQAAREARDAEVDKLERTYEPKIKRLEDKLRKEERELAEGEAEYSARQQEQWVGIGESVLGFFMGRRSTRAVSSAMSKRRMANRAYEDIEESKAAIAEMQKDIAELETELKEASEEITSKWENALENLTTEEITPRRTDVNVRLVALAWVPSWLITINDGHRSRTDAVPAYSVPA